MIQNSIEDQRETEVELRKGLKVDKKQLYFFGGVSIVVTMTLCASVYLQVNHKLIQYYQFLDHVIIGGFRIVANLMLCYLFLVSSLNQKNTICQIDSLGRILIVKQAKDSS
jgi:hypothetical protein